MSLGEQIPKPPKNCGISMTEVGPQTKPFFVLPRCPRCGTETPLHAKVCPSCGSSMKVKTVYQETSEEWDEGSWQDGPSKYTGARKPSQVRKHRFHLRPQLVGTILITIIALAAGLAIGPFVGRPTTVTTTTTVTNVVHDTVIVTVTVTTTAGGTQPTPATTTTQQTGKWISSSTNVVSYLQAANYVGQSKIVEGKIVRTYASSKGTVFLDFHDPYQGYFEVTIFASDVKNFPFSPVSFYLNKEVRVTGTIEMYQGAPEIIVHSPSQIEVAYMGFNYP